MMSLGPSHPLPEQRGRARLKPSIQTGKKKQGTVHNLFVFDGKPFYVKTRIQIAQDLIKQLEKWTSQKIPQGLWDFWKLLKLQSLGVGKRLAPAASDRCTKYDICSGKHGWRSSALLAFIQMTSKCIFWVFYIFRLLWSVFKVSKFVCFLTTVTWRASELYFCDMKSIIWECHILEICFNISLFGYELISIGLFIHDLF